MAVRLMLACPTASRAARGFVWEGTGARTVVFSSIAVRMASTAAEKDATGSRRILVAR